MIVIGLVVGLGIFRTSRDVAGAALSSEIFFAAWIAGGLLSICGGLTFAEIGSRYPVTGGYYAIFSYAYHPSIAFAINCVILVSNAASLAGVALIGSEYLLELIYPGYGSSAVLSAIAILLFYFVNLAGLNVSSRTQNFLMIIKILVLVVLIAAVFFVPGQANDSGVQLVNNASGWFATMVSFGLALKAVCFSYGGYQQTINFGGEVHNPMKTIPRSILLGILVVIVLYLLVNVSYYHIIGFNELKETNAIASIVAGRVFGKPGEFISGIIMFIAVLAYVNVILLSNPRVMVAMSNDGILPKQFSKRHEPTGVFRVSLTVFTMICVGILFFADSFNKILSFSIFLDCLGMVTAGITLFIFRRRNVQTHADVYKIKLYPAVPLIFILGYTFVAVVIAIEEPNYALTGTATLAFFLLLYKLIYGKSRTNG
jgi:APA family basic amino acid/polyamine antiporter